MPLSCGLTHSLISSCSLPGHKFTIGEIDSIFSTYKYSYFTYTSFYTLSSLVLFPLISFCTLDSFGCFDNLFLFNILNTTHTVEQTVRIHIRMNTFQLLQSFGTPCSLLKRHAFLLLLL